MLIQYNDCLCLYHFSKVTQCGDYATSSGDGSMFSVWKGAACSMVSLYIQIKLLTQTA